MVIDGIIGKLYTKCGQVHNIIHIIGSKSITILMLIIRLIHTSLRRLFIPRPFFISSSFFLSIDGNIHSIYLLLCTIV